MSRPIGSYIASPRRRVAGMQEGVQEGSGQAGGAVVQEGLLRTGRGDSGLKTVAQQNLAERRHQPPYEAVSE